MSLHKFAEQVAAHGRGDDSLLVHMTPDEVQRLQKFAEANGRTLTINPHTGLPEAGFLSDLFKAVAPIALGAFLGPAGMGITFGGLSSAASAGLLTGGITSLATGSLSRGLMAGMGAYGGAGLGEGLMNAGTAAMGTSASLGAGIPADMAFNLADAGVESMGAVDATSRAIAQAQPTAWDKLSAGAKAVTASPEAMGSFAKNNLGNLAYAASPILAGMMVPTTTKMPTGQQDSGYIRQQVFDPISQTYRSLTPVKANEWKDRSFSDIYRGYAGGGIVALAGGGDAANTDPNKQIFDYFAQNQGKDDATIAAQMRAQNWTPEMVANATGTQNQLADYQRRFAAQQPVTTGGLDTLAANQKAVVQPPANTGIFQTVYDPKTGREFNSPAQAAQYGVTDYVTSLPSSIALPSTAQNAVTAWLAKPENTGKTAEQALDALGNQFGMTGAQFRNAEIQGTINYGDQQATRGAVATENQGLTPEQLTAKLQAYKAKPPTTAQEFAEQRALYADYANRYANSSWNYANMGGKAQDFSLKPQDYLATKFTGYAEPINFALSSMNQMSPDYKEMSNILTKNPEINDVINQLYKLNPEASVFNYINPKYAGGTDKSTMASNFNNAVIKNLAGDIERYGSAEAMRRFVDQQQNLLVTRPDAQGNLGNFNQTTMANPEYRALNAIKDSYTPIVDDTAWNKRIKNETGRDASIGSVYRDADTGKGLAIQYNQNGAPQEIRFINQQGQGTNVPLNDPAKLLNAFYESGMPSSAFTELSKAFGSEYLIPPPKADEKQYFLPALQNGVKFSDFANGNAAKVLASDSYLKDVQNRALADYQWDIQHGTPENAAASRLQGTVDKAVNDQKAAKAFLGDQGAAAPTGLAALAANQTATTQGATAPTGVATLTANQAAPNTGAAAYAAANNINLSKNIADWVAAHPNATDAQIDAEMAKYGVTGEDVAKALPQYGGSKGLSWALNQGNMGLAGLNKNILDYVASHGNTATDRIVAENTLAKYGLNEADVKRATGKTLDELFAAKKAIDTGTKTDTGTKVITKDDGTKVTRVTTPTDITTAPDVTLPPGIGGNTGPSIIGGGTTVNPNGTITTSPRIPGIPVGGFTGMTSLRDAYTQGGGSLGYTPYTPKTPAEHATMYNTMTGDSQAAYNYLMGQGAYPTKSGVGEIAKPYREAVMGMPASTNKAYNFVNGQYVRNPDYVAPMRDASGNVTYGMSLNEIKSTLAKEPLSGQALYDWAMTNNVTAEDVAAATGMKLSDVYAQFRVGQQAAAKKAAADKAAGINTDTITGGDAGDGGAAAATAADSAAAAAASATGNAPGSDGTPGSGAKRGGLMPMHYADGGITGNGQLNLNIPLNLGGSGGGMGGMGGYNGYSAAGGYQAQGSQNNVQQSGMPDFRNQIQGLEAQIQKLPSVMAYNDYGKSISGRPPTPDEIAQMQALQKAVQSDQGFMGLQSQMRGVESKYQQQAMRNQSPGLQQRYTQQGLQSQPVFANGGMTYAVGGGLGSLGSYSDGGRLLRGPGDGVSDSIPATIGAKGQPARLADGEFVVPARIVSELGNGSTEAGAKKLYAMMDRVQKARGKTTGKNKVAANSGADKYLPA